MIGKTFKWNDMEWTIVGKNGKHFLVKTPTLAKTMAIAILRVIEIFDTQNPSQTYVG